MSSATGKERRASKACGGCRTRKVRCDVTTTGVPCSKCRADGFECNILARKKRSSRRTLQLRRTVSLTEKREEEPPPSPPLPAESLAQHIVRHQIPHYRHLSEFTDWKRKVARGIPGKHLYSAGEKQNVSPRPILPSLPHEDTQYLKVKGAFDLPPKGLLDDLVANYFRIFHPFFPVVNKSTFLPAYRSLKFLEATAGSGISLLLLQSIIFTSCASIQPNVIEQMGFMSRKQARAVFHMRARCLYEFDYERDNIVVVQALLLMSHHYPSMTDQKHTWFWAQQAIGLAQGAGLHRNPGEVPQRRHWARIWWSCLSRDRLIAIGTGRPMHINSLDCSVPMLTVDDVLEEGDDDEDVTIKTTYLQFIKLCQYMEGILSLHATEYESNEPLQEQISICEDVLQHWMDHLPQQVKMPVSAPHVNKVLSSTYRAVLYMIYNIAVIALNQSHQAAPNYSPSEARLPSHKVRAAAQNIAEIAQKLLHLQSVNYCPTICVTAILPSLIVQLLIRKFERPKTCDVTQSSLEDSMQFISQLGDIYWHAEFYHGLFEMALNPTEIPAGEHSTEVDTALSVIKNARNGRTKIQPHYPSLPHSREHCREKAAQRQSSVAQSYGTGDGETNSDANSSEKTDPPIEDVEFNEQNIETAVFEDWLRDCGYYYNSLPSA